MRSEEVEPLQAIRGLITAAETGDARASAALFQSLYAELHRVASRQLRRNGSSVTLGATTLLHDCYVGLAERSIDFPDRARFIAYSAQAMRGLIVDYVRRRQTYKRGGEFHLVSLDTQIGDEALPVESEISRLHDALVELGGVDAALAELVDLKFFCGFSFNEIAALRGVSERTVQRDWKKARLVLHDVLLAD